MILTKSFSWRGRFFRYAPLILWIGVVLYASTSQGSMSQTSRIIRPLLEYLFPNSPEETITMYHGYIRKLAHLTEYGVLGLLASRAFALSPAAIVRRRWFVFAFAAAALVASIDEYNQSFNPARTGSIYDVYLDCAGALLLIGFYYFAFKKNSAPGSTAKL